MTLDWSTLNGWGYVYLAIVAFSYITGIYRLTQPRKATEPVTGGTAAVTVFLLPVLVGILYLPWLLAVKYPFNWAAWLYLVWVIIALLIALVQTFAGREARPARRGFRLWGRLTVQLAITVFAVTLSLFAFGVLS